MRSGTATRGSTPSSKTTATTAPPAVVGAALPAPTGAGGPGLAAPATAATGATEEATPSATDGGGDLDGRSAHAGEGGQGGDASTIPTGRLASTLSFVRSLGRRLRRDRGDGGGGRNNGRGSSGLDLAEVVKAAEVSEAAVFSPEGMLSSVASGVCATSAFA